MTTQPESMRHLMNLLESVQEKSVFTNKEIQAIDQALSGLNEEQLNELNLKKLFATSSVLLGLLAPGVSNALTSDEVKLASAVASCSAFIDMALTEPKLPASTRQKLKNLGNELHSTQQAVVTRAKKQQDWNGATEISKSYTTAQDNARKLITSGKSELFTQVVVQCIQWATQ